MTIPHRRTLFDWFCFGGGILWIQISPRLFELGYEWLAVTFFFSGVGLLYFSEGD